tara:strand:- start:280 stop:471 length:192 start_codon:yes stop_codon:yes gene_type:complete
MGELSASAAVTPPWLLKLMIEYAFSKHFVIHGNVESIGLLDAQIGAGGRNTSVTNQIRLINSI